MAKYIDAEGIYGWWIESKEIYGQCDLFAKIEEVSQSQRIQRNV